MYVVLIAGAIATGKTAVAMELAKSLSADLIRVRDALGEVLQTTPNDRKTLQVRGADLDRRTSGRWLRDYIEERRVPGRATIVDSLRTELQTQPILHSIVDSRLVFLRAHEETRRARYALAAQTDPVKASVDFDGAMSHETEAGAGRLRAMAHLVVDTDDLGVSAVAEEVIRGLGLTRPDG